MPAELLDSHSAPPFGASLPSIEAMIAAEVETPLAPEEKLAWEGLKRQLEWRGSVEQELIERGDRQLPDEPDRGFDIRRLESEPSGPHLTASEVMPSAFIGLIGGTAQKTKEAAVPDLARRLANGQNALLPATDQKLSLDFPINADEYAAAVAEGRAEAGLFDAEGRCDAASVDAEQLAALIEPASKQEVIEDALVPVASLVAPMYGDELSGLEREERRSLEDRTVLEAYELRDGITGNRTIRIVNLSSTPLSEEQLRQAVNAIRSSADKSGGGVFDGLHTITIVPEEVLSTQLTDSETGEQFMFSSSGDTRSDGTMIISERTIQRPEDRPPLSPLAEKFWKEYFDDLRAKGEYPEGVDVPNTAGNGEWEAILAHELEHIALKKNKVSLPGPGPTAYAVKSKREHEAELASIEYMGGERALAVPEEQRAAKREMWQQQRGSDDGLTYKEPLGPRFITCQELDVTRPLPPRLKDPNRTVSANIQFHLVTTTPN